MSDDEQLSGLSTMNQPDANSGPSPDGAVARRIQLVRLVGSCLALLIAVVFCHQFSNFQLHNFVFGAGFPLSHLPLSCRLLAVYSSWLLVLPPVILMVGTRRLLRERTASVTVEMLQLVTLLLALTLVVGCILLWQIPYTLPAGDSF